MGTDDLQDEKNLDDRLDDGKDKRLLKDAYFHPARKIKKRSRSARMVE